MCISAQMWLSLLFVLHRRELLPSGSRSLVPTPTDHHGNRVPGTRRSRPNPRADGFARTHTGEI
jgi:hypothetical protein